MNRIVAAALALFLFSPILHARRSSGYHRSYGPRSRYGYRARSRSRTRLYSNRGGRTARSSAAKGEFKRETGVIVEIGIGLMDQKKYEDAIPVLKRCVAVYPDAAECWAFLGDASWALDRRSDARDFWTKTIEIGGFTRINAAAVEQARKSLDSLKALEALEGHSPPAPSPSFCARCNEQSAEVQTRRDACAKGQRSLTLAARGCPVLRMQF